MTGGPALSNDEMSAAFHDSGIATVLAFALTLIVMGVAFGRVGKPILMLIVLAVSIAWSMGVVTLTVGHLSIFSVMFISIVVGIGIDYGIYFLFRYEEEMFLGRGLREALERTAVRTGPGMAIGALTAAGTFYVLMLTDFRGIQELGYIAGTSILLAWLSMMTLFPAVLMLVDRRHLERARERRPRAQQIERLHVPVLDRLTRYPVTVLVSSGVATGLALWALPSIGFDYNLLNLQAKGTESVVWERRILAGTGRSGFNALASASTLDELREKQRAFERLPSVSEVDSVVRVIPDGQADKIAIIKTFAPLVSPIRIGRSSPVDVERLRQALADIQRRFDVVAAEAGKELPAELVAIRKQTAALTQRLKTVDRETAEPALSYLQAQLYRDFVAKFYSLQRNLNPRTISIQDVPSDLRRKFVGEDGRFLLQIHPKVDIWEREGAQQFVGDLRKVDPEVTGAPVITYEATRLMERGYLQGTALAFILVGALTILMIRRVKESLLALLPLLISLLWTDRAHAPDRPQVQPRQRVGSPAHHRHLRGVRPERRPELHGGPPARGPAGGAKHGDGRLAERDHDHHRLREPDGRDAPGHLRARAPADDRHGLRARDLAGRAPGHPEADHAHGRRRRRRSRSGRPPPPDPDSDSRPMDAAVLFDFGGTLDADGVTWKERFFRLCLDEGVTIARERFDPVFYAADDALVGGVPDTLSIEDTIGRLATGVVGAIRPGDGALAARVATRFLDAARAQIERNRPMLARLSARYHLGIVSNFYGNLPDGVC